MDNMKSLEINQGYGGRPIKDKLFFVGGGLNSIEAFTEIDIEYILSASVKTRSLINRQ